MSKSNSDFRLTKDETREVDPQIRKEKQIKPYQPPGFEKVWSEKELSSEADRGMTAGSTQCCCDAVCACDTVTSGSCTCYEVCSCDSVCTCNAECSCVGNTCSCQVTGGYYTYYTYRTYYS